MSVFPIWEQKVGIGAETITWGTVASVSLAIPITNIPIYIDPGVNISEARKLSGVPYRRNDIYEYHQGIKSPVTTLEFQAVPTECLPDIFYTLFQRCWEGSASPYEKVFIPYGSGIDFAVSSLTTEHPHSLSIIQRVTDANETESHNLLGAIARSITLSSNVGEPLVASVEFIGKTANYDYNAYAETFTYGTSAPKLWQYARILMAYPDGSTASEQANDLITATASNSFTVAGDHTTEYASGNYVMFRSYEVEAGSSDTLVFVESSSGARAVTLDAGNYTAIELAAMTEAAIKRTSGFGNTYRIFYDYSTNKFTFERVSGSETFYVDEDNTGGLGQNCNALWGWDGTDESTASSITTDNATGVNNDVYAISSSTFTTSTVVSFAALTLDQATPDNAGRAYVYRVVNLPSFSITLTNNAVVKHYDSQTPLQIILGDFTGEGTLTVPWGISYTTDENYHFNAFISGYNVPMIVYWGSINGETDNDLGIIFTARYTGATLSGDDELVSELPFQMVGGGIRYTTEPEETPPVTIILADTTDQTWSARGS